MRTNMYILKIKECISDNIFLYSYQKGIILKYCSHFTLVKETDKNVNSEVLSSDSN